MKKVAFISSHVNLEFVTTFTYKLRAGMYKSIAFNLYMHILVNKKRWTVTLNADLEAFLVNIKFEEGFRCEETIGKQ